MDGEQLCVGKHALEPASRLLFYRQREKAILNKWAFTPTVLWYKLDL